MVEPRYVLLGVREVGFSLREDATVRRLAVVLHDPGRARIFVRVVTGTIDHHTGALCVRVDAAEDAGHGLSPRVSDFPSWVVEAVSPHPAYGTEYALLHAGASGGERVRVFSAASAFLANGRMVEGYTPRVKSRPALDLDDYF